MHGQFIYIIYCFLGFKKYLPRWPVKKNLAKKKSSILPHKSQMVRPLEAPCAP